MLFSQDRSQLRRFYCQAWKRFRGGEKLQPLEQLIAEVVTIHPEYHSLLEQEAATEQEFIPELGESNPFLHLSLHLAVREQASNDRPQGIGTLYQQFISKTGDIHEAEHGMMECLAEMLWKSTRKGIPPDEAAYLDCLKKYLKIKKI